LTNYEVKRILLTWSKHGKLEPYNQVKYFRYFIRFFGNGMEFSDEFYELCSKSFAHFKIKFLLIIAYLSKHVGIIKILQFLKKKKFYTKNIIKDQRIFSFYSTGRVCVRFRINDHLMLS